MEWTIRDAADLLTSAFPLGAHVTVENGKEFLAVRYEVLEDDFGVDGATLRFERDPGDTLQRATRDELEAAAASGTLELDSGATIRQPEVEDVDLLASPFRDLVGPQSASDALWVARMRLHQSWWRTFRLQVPYGRGPTKGSTKRFGNMLDDHAAAAGRNFLTPEAQEAYERRVAVTQVGVDSWRTTRNLLASQPMAFNLFGHLSQHLDLATALFSTLLGEDEVGKVTSIEIERLSGALGDRTAFDAFATYLRPDGAPACLAIETKLTEPFSQQAYNWDAYLQRPAFDPADWTTSDPAVLGDRRWSQLWRNHLLARAETAANPELGPAKVLVVHHPLDPHCDEAVEGYRALLRDSDQVRPLHLGTIADALADLVASDAGQATWVQHFKDRYLELRLSESLMGVSDLAPSE